jgi:hypothetical protein
VNRQHALYGRSGILPPGDNNAGRQGSGIGQTPELKDSMVPAICKSVFLKLVGGGNACSNQNRSLAAKDFPFTRDPEPGHHFFDATFAAHHLCYA